MLAITFVMVAAVNYFTDRRLLSELPRVGLMLGDPPASVPSNARACSPTGASPTPRGCS
jgi:hypothetical protein